MARFGFRPEGRGFTLEVDPQSQSVCAPPADEAVYTIDVEPTGDFDEVVTLTADGAPAGASIDFSVNSVVPPFTSTMTISGFSGVTPGTYPIAIDATATTFARSLVANLETLADT